MTKLRIFDWRTGVLVLGFVISLALIGIFAVRSINYVPRQRGVEPIRPWMSVPYIAHSYHIPAQVLYQALGLPDNRPDRRPIAVIAREQGRSIQSLILVLNQAILRSRPTRFVPTSAPAGPTRSAP
jgi:hypothetical protein